MKKCYHFTFAFGNFINRTFQAPNEDAEQYRVGIPKM